MCIRDRDITENVTIPSTLYKVTIDLNGKRWSGGTDIDEDGKPTCLLYTSKASFGAEKLQDNFDALMGAIIKAKPAAAKGQYVRSLSLIHILCR